MSALFVAGLALLQAGLPADGRVQCDGERCALTLGADELLKAAERLVIAGKFAEAAPLIAALEKAPQYEMDRLFLEGYVAVETGDPKTAVEKFRSILERRPDLVRVRLELARALAMLGKDSAADYHFRLAEEGDLPPEIERTIYASRRLIRDHKRWELNVGFGLAPDTNVNSATSNEVVDINLGGSTLPVELDPAARRRSGVGQTGSLSGSLRLGRADQFGWRLEGDAQAVNYAGTSADDIFVFAAAGPEWRTQTSRLGIAATTGQRWYGGEVAQRLFGGRASIQYDLNEGARGGLQLDVRRQDSGINRGYDGTVVTGSGTYERVVRRTLVAAVSPFVRWETLQSQAYSNTEVGLSAGIGGELPFGINGGINASGSYAHYKSPLAIFDRAREDWRLSTRLYAGIRSVRIAGFSPSVSYTFTANLSNIGLYDFDRHRVALQLERYF